jgi:drug/metabolite transporter (DMT)-like permease
MQARTQHTSVFAIVCLLSAATLWGVFWYPLRWLEQFGLHGVWITFLVYCGTLVYSIPIILMRRREFLRQPGLLLLVSISSGWCNTAFILAMLEGEVVRVVLLFYLSPLWATLLARLVLKESLQPSAWWLLLMALGGAMLMLWSPQIGYPWPQSRADWLGLSSGLAFAMMNLFVHMANRVSIQTKTVSAWLGVILVAGSAILLGQGTDTQLTLNSMTYAMFIGITLMGGMTWLVVYGVTHMPVHRSAVILLFEVVAASVSTYALTSERLSLREWLGGAVVVVAAYLSARRQSRVITINGNQGV